MNPAPALRLNNFPAPVPQTRPSPRLATPPKLVPSLARSDKLAKVTGEREEAPKCPAIIVLGRDDSGKAHASWFSDADSEAAGRAAAMMGFVALPAATDELRGLAGRLPAGRLFASGRAFVPFVGASLFTQLARHLPAGALEAAKAANQPQPGGADKADKTIKAEVLGASTSEGPSDWSKVKKDDLVLATESPGEGWYECVVVEANPSGLLSLRWRDYPDWETFNRRREHVALLHPSYGK